MRNVIAIQNSLTLDSDRVKSTATKMLAFEYVWSQVPTTEAKLIILLFVHAKNSEA